jgi:hypothetical protein
MDPIVGSAGGGRDDARFCRHVVLGRYQDRSEVFREVS